MSSSNMFYKLLIILIVLHLSESGRYRSKPSKSHSSSRYTPSAPRPPQTHYKPPQTNQRPIGFDPPPHQTHTTNLGNANNQGKPIGWNVPPNQQAPNQRPIGFDPQPHGGTHVNQQPGTHFNTNQQPGTHFKPNQQQPGTHWNTNQQPGGTHWNANQQPGTHWNTNQQPGTHWNTNQQPGGGGYWNNYQHGNQPHYGGYGGHPGGQGHINYGPVTYINNPGSSQPYHYSSSSTGSGALGFFLGYGLAKLTTPSFHSGGDFNRHYDHYEVHHYYHNKEAVPSYTVVRQDNIDLCTETSSILCSGNTTALCTRNGTIMCVAKAQYVEPCSDKSNINCIKTTIPCVNSTISGCENKQNSTTIMVPCISSASIYGNITYVNNTIVLNLNSTQLNSTTQMNATLSNSTIITSDGTGAGSNITNQNGTQTQPAATSQVFCVTVLAVPAASKPSEPKIIYDKHKDVFNTFVKSIWGI